MLGWHTFEDFERDLLSLGMRQEVVMTASLEAPDLTAETGTARQTHGCGPVAEG
jgi:hypothetical protein